MVRLRNGCDGSENRLVQCAVVPTICNCSSLVWVTCRSGKNTTLYIYSTNFCFRLFQWRCKTWWVEPSVMKGEWKCV